jgi:hypothetical protein
MNISKYLCHFTRKMSLMRKIQIFVHRQKRIKKQICIFLSNLCIGKWIEMDPVIGNKSHYLSHYCFQVVYADL